jgi:dsRNA-specific ribonuclease
MAITWEEYRDVLCQKLEHDFRLPTFANRDYPIKALTSNDRITQDPEFLKHMKKNAQKDLAIIGDAVVNFLIYEHFLGENSLKNSKDLNTLRETFGKNRTLHLVSKTLSVNLKNYIIKTDNDSCWEKGITCLAVYFEALVAIIFIQHGIDETRKFFQTISFFENVKKMFETN